MLDLFKHDLSKYTLLEKEANKKADLIADSEIRLLTPFKDRVHSMTKDYGLEFCNYARVAKSIKAGMFFANPYASWDYFP